MVTKVCLDQNALLLAAFLGTAVRLTLAYCAW